MVVFIWFILFVIVVFLLFGWNFYRYIFGKGYCLVDWENGGLGLVYFVYLVFVSFFVLFGIFLYIYCVIYLKMKC